MNRTILYSLLFLAVILLQIFILDRLTFGVSIAPMAYVAFIILLPMQSTQLQMVLLGFALGVTLDLGSGMAGVNTIATLPVAYFRFNILGWIMGKDIMEMGGIPTVEQTSWWRMVRYVALMTSIHSLLYYLLESLSLLSWHFHLTRFGLSFALAFAFVSLIVFMFGFSLRRRAE